MSQLAQVTLGELVLCLSSWGFLPRMVDKPFICSLKHSTTVNRRHLPGVIEIGKMSHFHQRLAAKWVKTPSDLRAQMNGWGQDVNPCLFLICWQLQLQIFISFPKCKTSFTVINSEAVGQQTLNCGMWHSINITKRETHGMTPNSPKLNTSLFFSEDDLPSWQE